jgi:transposase
MDRVSRVKAHLDINAVRQKIETSKSDWLKHRWLIVYQALVEPKSAVAIAQELGVSVALVHKVISRYNREGVAAIETLGKGGRRNCYCSLKQEKEFLTKFHKRVAAGERLTTAQIKQAYEQQVGRSVHKSTVYRLLVRHGWRQQK